MGESRDRITGGVCCITARNRRCAMVFWSCPVTWLGAAMMSRRLDWQVFRYDANVSKDIVSRSVLRGVAGLLQTQRRI